MVRASYDNRFTIAKFPQWGMTPVNLTGVRQAGGLT